MSWLQKIPFGAKVFIYGAGKYGNKILKKLQEERPDIVFKGFIDTYRRGESIIPWETFEKERPECDLIIIGSEMYWEEMEKNVKKTNIKFIIPALEGFEYEPEKPLKAMVLSEIEHRNIEKVFNLIEQGREVYKMVVDSRIKGCYADITAYYRKVKKFRSSLRYIEYISLPSEGVVIEGGVFIGEITKKILSNLDTKGKLFGFDIYGDKFLPANLKNDHRVDIYKLALWKEKTVLYFPSYYEKLSPGGTFVSNKKRKGFLPISATSIDEFVSSKNLKRVDFIKLDVEGAEVEVLKGAKETIMKFKPKMAIAVYHKFSHYYEIPLFIKSIYPRYRIIFDHYSPRFGESIMYFLPE